MIEFFDKEDVMKRTKVISVLLIMGMTVGMLAGCGKSSDSKKIHQKMQM